MVRISTLHKRFVAGVAVAFLLSVSPAPAHATSKEMIELQTQVQQLLDMVQRLQSTLDTRLGVMQHMLEQTADNTNQMTASVNQLQLKLNAVTDANGAKLDTVSGQVQSLNDSVDELKSRIAKLDKNVQDLQAQLQSMQAPAAAAQPGGQPADPNAGQGGGAPTPAPTAPPATVAPPLKDTFQAGYRDYMAAHYGVATSEFQDVIHFYPMDDLAGSAQFYLGEIAYRQLDYPGAIKAYNAVLEGFPGNSKAPAAQLRKGLALLQLGKKDAGIHELRTLVQRHPQTPEADQARKKLNGMGVRIVSKND
jgi:tol-pal system protein YbgF